LLLPVMMPHPIHTVKGREANEKLVRENNMHVQRLSREQTGKKRRSPRRVILDSDDENL
jgi:hypothetical protein